MAQQTDRGGSRDLVMSVAKFERFFRTASGLTPPSFSMSNKQDLKALQTNSSITRLRSSAAAVSECPARAKRPPIIAPFDLADPKELAGRSALTTNAKSPKTIRVERSCDHLTARAARSTCHLARRPRHRLPDICRRVEASRLERAFNDSSIPI